MVMASTTDANGVSAANGAPNGGANGHTNGDSTFSVKAGLAQMLKGGVIMDVVNAEQVRSVSPASPTSICIPAY